MPASYNRIPVKAIHKRLVLVVCFAFIFIEYQAGTLFLWPLDHSCAKPANLTIFTELFTDSKSQPIDLDAVQRNLFDATPEDSFTMARAASMGIEYDDVARCFEYSVDYQDGNQPVINMDNLEPCRFGLHFELLSSQMSIISHYNLACRRQWLKMLVPQSFSSGLLSGLLLTYFVLLGASRKFGTRRSDDEMRRVKLIPWTGFNLTTFVVLYLVTLILNQCYLNNSLRAAPLAGDSAAKELVHRERSYFLFVFSIFLRSALMGSMICRVMIKWKATSMDVNNFKAELNDFHRMCFISFAIALVVLKMSFIPLAMKLFDCWSSLSLFLTLSQVLLLAMINVFELLRTRSRFYKVIVNEPQMRPSSLSTQFNTNQKAPPGNGHDNEPLDNGPQPCNLEIASGAGLPVLFDMDEMTNSTTSTWANRWQTTGVQGLAKAPFKACEFCSIKDERIFGIMNQLRCERVFAAPADTTDDGSCYGSKRDETNRGPGNGDESSRVAHEDNLSAYLPTTMPLDRLAYVTAAEPIEMRLSRAMGSFRRDKNQLPMNALSNPRSSGQIDANSSRPTNQNAGEFPSSIRVVQHNSSLFELNVTRWPLMSKLMVLTFCLALNYFLMQTIPNHKLQHGESIPSLMDRKTSHRGAQLETGDAHQNSSRGLAPTAARSSGGGELRVDAIKISGRPDQLEAVEFVHHPRLVSREQYRTISGPAAQLVGANQSESPQRSNNATKRTNESSPLSSADARDDSAGPSDKIDPHLSELLSISAIVQVGPEYAISNHDERALNDSSSRDKKLPHNVTRITTTIGTNKTIEDELLKSNELAINLTDANSTSKATISFNQIDFVPPTRNDLALTRHAKYKYDVEPVNGTDHSLLGGPDGGSNLEDLLRMNISHLFNYNSVDYASRTFDRLVRSWNPLELVWIMMKLNGWPVELAIILLYSAKLTDFEQTHFKLNRLFSLPVYGSKLLAAEWLLVALAPKQNHLLEPDWLLGFLLLLARFASSLMLFSYLHMILKLSARLDSQQPIIKIIETIQVALCALTLAFWAPILERVSLMVTPLLLIASSSAIYYLARGLETQFKDLLCPMLFE